MKKLFLILVTGFLFSCNNSKTSQNETDSMTTDSTSMDSMQPAPVDGATSSDSLNSTTGTAGTASRSDTASVSGRDSVRVR